MSVAPPVTVVTGAGGALGRAVTELLLGRGHAVAGVDQSTAPLDALVASHPGRCSALAFDVTSHSEWREAIARIVRELGAPTGAVLCAGGWAGGTPEHAQSDDAVWQRMLTMNLETARVSVRALLPGMVERRQGSIVVIGSRAVARPWESAGAAAYAAAKSAVVAYAQAVAADVLPAGVRVNAVLPSVIDTNANRAAMPGAEHDRWVSTASLAGVIAFLLSDEARDLSGAALPVYGRV